MRPTYNQQASVSPPSYHCREVQAQAQLNQKEMSYDTALALQQAVYLSKERMRETEAFV